MQPAPADHGPARSRPLPPAEAALADVWHAAQLPREALAMAA